jgi:hypothetical protein
MLRASRRADAWQTFLIRRSPPSWEQTRDQAQALTVSLGADGLFIADRDGELLAADLTSWGLARDMLERRPCAVFGCWRAGGLLAQDPAVLPPALRAERLADARLYGWDPTRVGDPGPASRAACCARLQTALAAACRESGLHQLWLSCAYRERGRPLGVEPAVVVTGTFDPSWVVAQAGACNQQHLWAATEGQALRPQLAERDGQGAIIAYRPIAGSPPRLRLVVGVSLGS